MFVGEYQLPLNSVDLAGPVEEWKDLAAVDDGSNQYLGDLCLSLRYVPSTTKLTGEIFADNCSLFLVVTRPVLLEVTPEALEIYFFVVQWSM